MRKLLISLILLTPIFAWGGETYSHQKAVEFLIGLKSTDPLDQELQPIRRYELRDIDNDGKFEILVTSSEDKAGNFIYSTLELAPALEWTDIYSFKSGAFVVSNDQFKWFYQEELEKFQLWLRIFETPLVLSESSQSWLNTEDKVLFGVLINSYISRIENIIK